MLAVKSACKQEISVAFDRRADAVDLPGLLQTARDNSPWLDRRDNGLTEAEEEVWPRHHDK